ncbi:MAG: TetR/AcrR family transcriptional regulator [Bacteroidales bacterium]
MSVNEKIVTRAVELFIDSGIRTITMDDIARDAGVSKRTIYENFRDKDDLLKFCLEYMDDVHSRENERIFSEAENTVDLVFRFVKQGIKALNTVNPLFFSDLKKYHYRIWKETYTSNYEKHLSKTFLIIEKGIDEGLFRKNIDVEVVAILINTQLQILSDEKIFPSDRFSKTVVFENIMINFVRGIATRKGLDLIENYLDG